MVLNIVGRSPNGALIRSPLGARTVEGLGPGKYVVMTGNASVPEWGVFQTSGLSDPWTEIGVLHLTENPSGLTWSGGYLWACRRNIGTNNNQVFRFTGADSWQSYTFTTPTNPQARDIIDVGGIPHVVISGTSAVEVWKWTEATDTWSQVGSTINLFSASVRCGLVTNGTDVWVLTNSPAAGAASGAASTLFKNGVDQFSPDGVASQTWFLGNLLGAVVISAGFHSIGTGAKIGAANWLIGESNPAYGSLNDVPHVAVWNDNAYSGGRNTTPDPDEDGLVSTDGATVTMPVVFAANEEVRNTAANGDSGVLFVGDFTEVNGDTAEGIALWDGSAATPFTGSGMPTANVRLALVISETDDVPLIATVADASVAVGGGAYVETLAADGASGPIDRWSLGEGPAGATMDAFGEVTWPTPVKAGSPHQFIAYVSNESWFDIEVWDVTVQDTAPTVAAQADDVAVDGSDYEVTPTLSAGDTPVVWSLTTAPAGASIDPDTGEITWPASGTGTVDWTVRATNAVNFDEESWETTIESQVDIAPIADDSHSVASGAYQKTPTLLDSGSGTPLWIFTDIVPPVVGATINSSTGVVDWPSPTVGSVLWKITVLSGASQDSEQWTTTFTA